MFPLVNASVAAQSSSDLLFSLDQGWTCRVMVLDEGLVRVLFTPPDGSREPRTWSIAPGGNDVGWNGRSRTDRSGFPCPDARIEYDQQSAVIHTQRLQVTATLRPFGLTWATAGRLEFAADRPTLGGRHQDMPHAALGTKTAARWLPLVRQPLFQRPL